MNEIRICVCERTDELPSCAKSGSDAVFKAFEEEIRLNRVRGFTVEKSGCLGQCFNNPAVSIGEVSYNRVQVEDVPEIVRSHLINGEPVSRLLAKKRG